MEEMLPDTNPHKIHLVRMLHNIEDEIPMEMPDIVLVLMLLNTEEKVERFTDWVRTRFDGEKLNTTAPEILGAASRIGDGRTDLP